MLLKKRYIRQGNTICKNIVKIINTVNTFVMNYTYILQVSLSDMYTYIFYREWRCLNVSSKPYCLYRSRVSDRSRVTPMSG